MIGAPEKRRFRRRLCFGSITVLALGMAVLFLARPAYRQVKGWRSQAIARESLSLSAEGRTAEALQKGRAAYQLAPREPLALRALAAGYVAAGETGQALLAWERLVLMGAATEKERQAMAAAKQV